MLERFAGMLPLVSVVALLALAAFNIGYFGLIGIHFLGVVDLSNIVYSFALSFGLIGIMSGLLGANWFDDIADMAKRSGAYERFRYFTLAVKIAALLLGGLAIFGYWQSWFSWGSFEGAMLGALFALFFVLVLETQFAWHLNGSIKLGEIIFVAFMGVMTATMAGRYMAMSSMTRGPTYTIVTKANHEIQGVRIMRSSSSGFIFAIDRVIYYFPQGELKSIRAEAPI